MAESEESSTVKDEQQLKKEKKELERQQKELAKQQKEKEKREKKLERERKKQEEKERKLREKEAARAEKQKQQQTSTDGEGGSEPILAFTEDHQEEEAAQTTQPCGSPQPPNNETKPAAAVSEGLTDVSVSWPEKVTVAETPSQISGCGVPIDIVFNATQAGKGTLTASCTGSKIGDVPTTVTGQREGIFSVKLTPTVADVFTLSVFWGGKEISGSPFSLNLSRLSSVAKTSGQQTEGEKASAKEEKAATKGKEKEEEEVEEVSDDPFEMAFQASRMLEEHRVYAEPQVETSTNHSTYSPPSQTPSPPPSNQQLNHSSPASPPYPTHPSTAPYPQSSLVREEDLKELHDINKTLQQTNEGLSGEVADLKKKMGEFETKLITIEQSSQASEEERKELMAHVNTRGWLYKRGIKGPTANVWRQRYFRCDQGSKICYYKLSDESVPRGQVDLEKVEGIEEVSSEVQEDSDIQSDGFCFNVVCNDRTYELRADTEDMRKKWMIAIEYLKDWYQKNKIVIAPPKLP